MLTPPDTAASFSATSGLEALGRGDLSAAGWMSACLGRIEDRDPQIRAWAFLDVERARAEASESSRPGATRGPLSGLPIGIKDVIDVAGMPTRCNSPTTAADPLVKADSACVARLRAAGAIVVGKTVTTEFAFTEPGPTVNPHDPRRTPGGSSSGSAAAVADFHVPVALTTQTGGSTIRPAAYCGVVGYKPPFGHVPTRGLRFLAPSMDHIGLHARCVADIALVASVLEGRPRTDSPVRPVRLLRLSLPSHGLCDPAVADRIEEVCARLRAEGVPVDDLSPIAEFDGIDAAHRTLMSAEVARSFSLLHASRPDLLSDSLRSFIERGQSTTEDELAEARALVARIAQRLFQHAESRALLVLPSTLETAPIGLGSTGNAVLNRPWSLLGLGVVSLPVGRAGDGMPIGLQIVDPHPCADRLLPTARFIESMMERA